MSVERMSMKSKMLMSSTGMKIVQYLPQQQEKNPYNKCQYVESIKIHWIKNERLMLKNALGKSGDFRRNYLNTDLILHQNQSNQTDGQANHRFENIPEGRPPGVVVMANVRGGGRPSNQRNHCCPPRRLQKLALA